jgi:hypothetical protein
VGPHESLNIEMILLIDEEDTYCDSFNISLFAYWMWQGEQWGWISV